MNNTGNLGYEQSIDYSEEREWAQTISALICIATDFWAYKVLTTDRDKSKDSIKDRGRDRPMVSRAKFDYCWL